MSFPTTGRKVARKKPGDKRSVRTRALAMCERLAQGGVSLRSAAKAEGLSHTRFLELVRKDAEMRVAYEAALEAGTHEEIDALGRECVRVMKTARETAYSGPYVSAFGHKLKLTMWRAEKRAPKVYGQKVEQTVKGDPMAPVALKLVGSDIHG